MISLRWVTFSSFAVLALGMGFALGEAPPGLTPPTSPSEKPAEAVEKTAPTNLMDAAADPNLRLSPDGGFYYEPEGKRDPFRSFFVEEIPTTPGGVAAPVDSLQAYDLSQLKVVAILWNVGDPKALIRSPSGKLFMVRSLEKSKIGRNKGYVASIREGEVVVFELSQDGKTPATRILALQK